jgi:CHAD domain-containing protein
MRRQPQQAVVSPSGLAAGSRRIDTALREQQRLLRTAAARLELASGSDVHHGRIAARRMRSLLRSFRPLLDVRRARLMRAELRSFARALAAVREADVRRDLLLALARRDPEVAPGDFQRLSLMLEDLCLEARASLRRHVAEPGWDALGAAILGDTAADSLLVRRDAGLDRLLRAVDKSWREAVQLLESEPTQAAELHALRLRLKHCRYALEPVADVRPEEAARLLRRLRAAQDLIGEHRDTLLAEHWVRLNNRSLGGHLSRRLLRLLKRHEQTLRKQAARQAGKVLPAYRQWRKAIRPLRKARTTGRASRGRARPSSARS